jgi:Predicted aminopeptidase, Iap family
MKRMVALVLVFSMLFCMVGVAEAQMPSAYETYVQAIDMAIAESVPDTISLFGDNSDVGNRSSGSKAERETADFIKTTFEKIGLENVTVDEYTADGWSFNRGRIYYTDINGEQQYLLLGGYATHLVCDMQTANVVYAGKGTMADYENLDVTGKVVLIDIDQRSEWWISLPVIEAHLRGALAVLACNVDGYAQYDKDTIGSQDICGPFDAPAFAVSKNTSAKLQELITAGNGEAKIVLDVESVVTLDVKGQNIWGEIPGKTDEVIYFAAHYDGYYHSYFDDATGVGYLCAIAKAMVDSGYQPDKTMRFVAHGSEEWGKTDTEYDWAIGAFKQITEVRPEWAEKAFAMLNLDGLYPIIGHKNYTVNAVYELQDFAAGILEDVYGGTPYTCTVASIPGCWTEDFAYTQAGVPSIVTSSAEEETYRVTAYHSSMDSKVLGLDMDAYKLGIQLFGGYALTLDALAARPMNFSARFKAMKEVYQGNNADFDALYAAALAMEEKIADLNTRYIDADENTAVAIRAEGLALNAKMFEAYDFITDTTVAFDWEDSVVFPFEQCDTNIEALNAAIEALEAGDATAALDEYLYAVDYNWYAYEFSKSTYDYNVARIYEKATGTWGEGLIQHRNEDLYDVIHSLMEKAEAEDADLSPEIEALKSALNSQLQYQNELDAELTENMKKAAEMLAI